MKRFPDLILGICLSATALAATVPFEIPAEANAVYSERSATRRLEVNTNAPLSEVVFSCAFPATASNNVELAFGTMEGADETLPAECTDLIVAWDCGEWTASAADVGEVAFVPGAAASATNRALTLRWRFDSHTHALKLARLSVDDQVWAPEGVVLWKTEWNRVRLTVRGECESSSVSATGELKFTPLVFIVR